MVPFSRTSRTVFGLLASVTAVGCATAIPYTGMETCAFDNMKLTGIGHSNGTAHSYNYNLGITTANSYSTNISCEVPKTDEDKAEVQALRASLKPKVDYNEGIKSKKLLTGLGYVLWIIPGIGAKVYFDSQYDAAIKASNQLSRAPASTKYSTP